MPIDLSIPSTGKITLFVEDPLTRDYLREVWENPIDVVFRLGGGNDGVRAIVKTFEDEGHPNVFGVTDRDFREANRDEWFNPAKTFRTFVLPVHEIENCLLHADALHASTFHNRNLSRDDIENRMSVKAKDLCWWAACRETIAELKRRFREPFVPDPSQAIGDRNAAIAHICNSPWFAKLGGEAARSERSDIEDLLASDHLRMSDRLADGTWRQDFPGKEILRGVAGWMCDRPAMHRFPSRDSDFYSDLAKEIGRWQVANDDVPDHLKALLEALRRRIANARSVSGSSASGDGLEQT